MRPIPIFDPEDSIPPLVTSEPAAELATFDPFTTRSTAFAVVGVTLFWFAMVTALMWLAGRISGNELGQVYILLAAVFSVSSVCLFALAADTGRPTARPLVGLATFISLFGVAVVTTWLGALVEVRWVVLPVTYGVGLYLTRHHRSNYSMPCSKA